MYEGNKEVLHIPQSSSITGVSLSDCLVSYPGHYPSAEMQLVYSTAPADWARNLLNIKLENITNLSMFNMIHMRKTSVNYECKCASSCVMVSKLDLESLCK